MYSHKGKRGGGGGVCLATMMGDYEELYLCLTAFIPEKQSCI